MLKTIKKTYRKFKAWSAYNPPGALSSKGWRLFKLEFKDRAPVRYYFHYNFKQTFLYPIMWKYKDIRYWLAYRTTQRYHILNTGLTPGYCEIETKMLHVNFNMLKDFVEVEQAWSKYVWSGESDNASWCEKHMPFYRFVFPFRRPDLGVRHFEWAATLDDPSIPASDRSEYQARDAREVLALYQWWVDIRPNRKPIEHVSYSEQGMGTLGCLDDDFDANAEDYKAHVASMHESHKQEEDWDIEDGDMLIRLMKIRKGLWT